MGISDWGLRIARKTAHWLVAVVVMDLLSGAAAAGELEHHWEDPAYLGEMRLQVAAMMVIVFGAAAWSWFAHVRRKRSR